MPFKQVGAPRLSSPRRKTGLLRSVRRVLFPILLPVGLIAAVWQLGPPHILFEYTYQPSGQLRLYERCQYLGIFGWVELRGNPLPNCPYVTLIRHENWPLPNWKL